MPPMSQVLPWLFLLVALWMAFLILNGTAPTPCSELPQAFDHGMKTEYSSSAIDALAASCRATDRATHETFEKTIVNWSGIVASVAGCAAAWLLGATIARMIDWRRGLLAAAALLLVAAAALMASFA